MVYDKRGGEMDKNEWSGHPEAESLVFMHPLEPVC